jgi:hypothetical protein
LVNIVEKHFSSGRPPETDLAIAFRVGARWSKRQQITTFSQLASLGPGAAQGLQAPRSILARTFDRPVGLTRLNRCRGMDRQNGGYRGHRHLRRWGTSEGGNAEASAGWCRLRRTPVPANRQTSAAKPRRPRALCQLMIVFLAERSQKCQCCQSRTALTQNESNPPRLWLLICSRQRPSDCRTCVQVIGAMAIDRVQRP